MDKEAHIIVMIDSRTAAQTILQVVDAVGAVFLLLSTTLIYNAYNSFEDSAGFQLRDKTSTLPTFEYQRLRSILAS